MAADTPTAVLTDRERALVEPLHALITWMRNQAMGAVHGMRPGAEALRERADQAERELEEAVRA